VSLTSPVLTYDTFSYPFPLQASAESGALTLASIDLLATNGTGDDQVLDYILIQFPVGNEANSMTPDPTAIDAHAPPHWTTKPIPVEGYVRYLFQPEPGYATLPSGYSLMVSFFNIPVNRQPGTFLSEITEGTGDCGGDCPSITIPFTKFPSGWGSVAFWAEPANVAYQGNTTLKWRGPQGATYTIEYLDKSTGQVVHLPQSGKPPFSNNGEYPGQGNPALTLISDTTFTLNVSLVINNVLETAREQVMVSVGPPPPTTPRILSFNGSVNVVGTQLALTLAWKTEQADQVTITNVPGIQRPNDRYVLYQPYGISLASSYTLEATKGTKTAASTVNITWTPTTANFLGNRPVRNCAILPNGEMLFISDDVPDGYNLEVLDPMTLAHFFMAIRMSNPPPDFIAPSPDNLRVYFSQSRGGDPRFPNAFLAGYDASSLKSGSPRPVPGSPVELHNTGPFMLAVTPDNRRVYVSDPWQFVLVFDVSNSNFKQMKVIEVGGLPRGIAFKKDGSRAFVAKAGAASVAVIDTASLTVINTINTGSHPFSVAVSPDGRRLYVGNQSSQSVSVFDTDTFQELSGSPIGVSGGPSRLATSPDGTLLFVSCNVVPHCLNIIDTATLTLVRSIPTAAQPKSMAVSPDGIRVYLLIGLDYTPIWIYLPTVAGGTMSARRNWQHFEETR
jgi:YVTN family beta-propeller protein